MIKFKKILFIVIIGQVLFLCGVSFNMAQAQGEPYVPLVEIPNINSYEKQQSSDGLSAYLGNMYTFGVAIATLLAVIMIMWGGIEYMSTDSMGGKEGGKEKISNALFGLLLALGSYLILRTINQELLSTKLNIGTVRPEVQNKSFIPYSPVNLWNGGQVSDSLWFANTTDYTLPSDLLSLSPANNFGTDPISGQGMVVFNPTYMAIDTDGLGSIPFDDPDRQFQTSYVKPDGSYLNPNTDSFVVASDPSLLGKRVLVKNLDTGESVPAIVGDINTKISGVTLTGEMSLYTAQQVSVWKEGDGNTARQPRIEMTLFND